MMLAAFFLSTTSALKMLNPERVSVSGVEVPTLRALQNVPSDATEKLAFCSGACSTVSCGDDEVCDCGYCLENDYCDTMCDAISMAGGCPDGYACNCGLCSSGTSAVLEFDMDDFACTTSCDNGFCVSDYCFDFDDFYDEYDCESCDYVSCDSGSSCVCGQCGSSYSAQVAQEAQVSGLAGAGVTPTSTSAASMPAHHLTALALGGVVLLGLIGYAGLRYRLLKDSYKELDDPEEVESPRHQQQKIDIPTISSPIEHENGDSYGSREKAVGPTRKISQATEIRF